MLQNIENSLHAHSQGRPATVKRKRTLPRVWGRTHCRICGHVKKRRKRKSTVCYLLCKTEREIRKYSWTGLFLRKETQEGKSRNWDWIPKGCWRQVGGVYCFVAVWLWVYHVNVLLIQNNKKPSRVRWEWNANWNGMQTETHEPCCVSNAQNNHTEGRKGKLIQVALNTHSCHMSSGQRHSTWSCVKRKTKCKNKATRCYCFCARQKRK